VGVLVISAKMRPSQVNATPGVGNSMLSQMPRQFISA
jgi:hypothetical protein